MEHLFETELELPLPIEKVFAFFAEAANLQRITPPELHFQIMTPSPIDLKPGALIDYRLHLLGIPFGWRTVISAWDPPHSFTDEQLRGPYASWIHRHTFVPTEKGTMIRDRVRYRLPLFPFGEIAYPLVHHQISRIFAYRKSAVVAELMKNGAGAC
jgi:ligand-binding SRPBCC domain-containing protein